MRIQVPSVDHGQYLNNIASQYSFRKFINALSANEKAEFQKFHEMFITLLPLTPDKAEDQVVELILKVLRLAGWEAKDKRSSFVPGTEYKPDIWLNDRIAFVEVLKLKNSKSSAEWTEHCKRCVSYARHSGAQLAICTDSRRWFFVSTEDGDAKTAFIDLKRYDPQSEEVKIICNMLWSNGPLYKEGLRAELKNSTEIGKSLFKNHILKCVSKLDDNYREYFGLLSAVAYAHYNGTRLFNTNAILEATYALMREHNSTGVALVKEFISDLALKNLPGLSPIAARVNRLVGKNEKLDFVILKSILIDQTDKPISWETFNSDDLSEVYEAILTRKRTINGIYATPRDLCYEVVKTQLEKLSEQKLPKTLALVDPCCGSGSFIDQAVKAVGSDLLPIEQKSKRTDLKNIYFIGQDLEEMAAAISLVNVYVACIRYLWHIDNVQFDISISCGDTTDGRSPIYKKMATTKAKYTMIFGNPPYLRSRSAKLGGVTKDRNLLFVVTEKVMSLCQPGEVAFVLPAHVKGGDAAEQFDSVPQNHSLKLSELWHLPEQRIFRGCAEKRHIVAFWRPDSRASAKVFVLTPPSDAVSIGISKSINKSKMLKSLQFSTSESRLSSIPMFASIHIPEDVKNALSSLPRLQELKDSRILTIVQGVQEAHPFVPAAFDSKGQKTRYAKVIASSDLEVGEPMFVIPKKAIKQLAKNPRLPLTKTEKLHLRLHAKSSPEELRLCLPISSDKIIFTNEELGSLSEEEFSKQCPHFYAWLSKFHSLLMIDVDRKSKQLKWWELQRSRAPRPNAKTRPGIDFSNNKILVNQFLNGEMWAWFDENGHIAAGSSFNVISKFPNSEHENVRKNWHQLLTLWLNSYLIREVWLKLLGNCKLRGIDGEVQIKKHLLKIPIPHELIYECKNKAIEKSVVRLAQIATSSEQKITSKKLIEVDEVCWKLLEQTSSQKLGKPMTRMDGQIDLKASA